MTKNEIRREVRDRITVIDGEHRNQLDTLLCQQFINVFAKIREKLQKRSLNVLSYMPLHDEPDVTKIFADTPDITMVLPVSLPDGRLELRQKVKETTTGMYGITEPATDAEVFQPKTLDLAIVPGRAFSPTGDRLGRGKGYYDRLLADLSCPTVALAFDLQLYQQLPTEAHDKRIDIIITETTVYSDNYL